MDQDLEAARAFLTDLPPDLAQELDRVAIADSGQPFERLARGCLASDREAHARGSSVGWRPPHWRACALDTLALRLAIAFLSLPKTRNASESQVDTLVEATPPLG